jgi:D-glycero-D-manno-heptose 1,7-bisphosphate phosphatase
MKQKAVILDRDGVILNDENHYYIYKPEHYHINNLIIENLKLLAGKGFLLIVISNQSGIDRGVYSSQDTDRINNMLQEDMQQNGIFITEFYYCPHHPEAGNCFCRKPGSLLIEKAVAKYRLDQGKSFLIGNSESDIMAALSAGLTPFKIASNGDISAICKQIIQINSLMDCQEN